MKFSRKWLKNAIMQSDYVESYQGENYMDANNGEVGFVITKQTYDSFVGIGYIERSQLEHLRNSYGKNFPVFSCSKKFAVDTKADIENLVNLISDTFKLISFDENAYGVVDPEKGCVGFLKVKQVNYAVNTLKFIIFGVSSEAVDKFSEVIKKLLLPFEDKNINRLYFDWYVMKGGTVCDYQVPVVFDDIVLPEAYPFIPNLDEWINGFITGHENILILIGSPGTGKTRLIRQILRTINNRMETTLNVACTNSREVMENETFYFEFVSGDDEILVLEDSDYSLTSRKDGNDVVNKLLFTADGIIPSDKKIIMSTNLTIGKLDDALVRNGRCYGTYETRKLEGDEILNFVHAYNKAYGTTFDDNLIDKDKMPLCDIYKLLEDETKKWGKTKVKRKAVALNGKSHSI